MKIKLTDQELSRLGLINDAVPSLDGETLEVNDFSIDVETGNKTNDDLDKYESEYLSLAAINRSKNLLVSDLHKVAFSGRYSDLTGVPPLATVFKDGLISKEDYAKISNLNNYLDLKAEINHLHNFNDITNVPLASETSAGLMDPSQFRLLKEGLSKVATTGLYTDLNGKPEIATESQDGLLSKELYKEINAIAKTFGSSFSQNSSGIYVYNHTHLASEIYGLKEAMTEYDINIDKVIRVSDIYSSTLAGYDDNGNFYKGFMRGEDKSKLDRIDDSANYYVHPDKHNVTMIDGLANVATTGAYSDLLGTPDIIGTINSVDSQNGVAIGSTGGLQIRKSGLPRISFQRGIQYFHSNTVATKVSIELSDEIENQFQYSIANNVNMMIKNESGNMFNIKPRLTSYGNCELEVTGNLTLKHLQDPDAAGYNGLVLGTDTNGNQGNQYGQHSIGIIGDHTIGFGNRVYDAEEYTAFINTRTGDLYLKGDLYIQGTINSAYKDEISGLSAPASDNNTFNVKRNISATANDLNINITEINGAINMGDTILALLDKIEEMTDTIERQEIRIRQLEKMIY